MLKPYSAPARLPAKSLFLLGTLLLTGVTLPLVPGSMPSPNRAVCDPASLSATDAALIGEAYHLSDQLGRRIWSGWTTDAAPLLFKTKTCDFLIGHPSPPADFERADDDFLNRTLGYRSNRDSIAYQAAFPIGGVTTAVITAPRQGGSPHAWMLKAAHELFHVYQYARRSERVVNPFVGPHADKHELSYPFPYDDLAIRSLMRMEAELVFRALTAAGDDVDVRAAPDVLAHVQNVAARVFVDSLDLRYKRWQEWYEGVARYTERELARLAADASIYVPSPAFAERFSERGYGDVWEEAYARARNPIRFVGEGVQGRVQFYYLGMGKAYLLDRVDPDWKRLYFEYHLDDILAP